MRKKTLSVLLVLLLAFVMAACGNQGETKPEEKPAENTETQADEKKDAEEPAPAAEEKVITLAMVSAWDSLMPLNSNSNYGDVILDQIYDRLVSPLPNGEYGPELADSWETNEDSTAITFHLNKNAKFHDGVPVTAEDVVFSMRLFSDPNVNAVSRYYLNVIAGTDASGAELSEDSVAVEAVDTHTVKMQMKSAMFPGNFLLNVKNIPILPEHILGVTKAEDLNDPETWTFQIGSGPFKLTEKIDGERIEFAKNADYHQGAPKIDKLVVRVVPSTGLLSGLISGEIDVLAGNLGALPLDDWSMAKSQDNLVTQSIPTYNYQVLIINTEKPYMTQKVRQAISMAIDRNTLVNSLLQGEGSAIISPIVPMSTYYNKDLDIWYDPEKAKTMLEEENFPFDTELVFYVPAGNVTRERAALLIQQDLQKLGLKVAIQTVDFPTLMDSMRESKHDFGIIGSGGSPDPGSSREMIEKDSTVNFSLYRTTELQDIIDAGNAELTFEKRLPHFLTYQEKVREISAMLYLYATNDLMAYNKRVSGLNLEKFAVMAWDAWLWDIK